MKNNAQYDLLSQEHPTEKTWAGTKISVEDDEGALQDSIINEEVWQPHFKTNIWNQMLTTQILGGHLDEESKRVLCTYILHPPWPCAGLFRLDQ